MSVLRTGSMSGTGTVVPPPQQRAAVEARFLAFLGEYLEAKAKGLMRVVRGGHTCPGTTTPKPKRDYTFAAAEEIPPAPSMAELLKRTPPPPTERMQPNGIPVAPSMREIALRQQAKQKTK